MGSMTGGNNYDTVYQFTYMAGWAWDTSVAASDDPNAKPFGPPPFPPRENLIRPFPGPDLNVTIGQWPSKQVRYVPVKRRNGVDMPPALTVFIQLVPSQSPMYVAAWAGTSVDVEVLNLFNKDPFAPGGGGPDPTVKLQGTLGPNLVCQILIPPDKVKEWLKPDGVMKGRVNENLLDFRFKLNGVMDGSQPVIGQSRNRLFLYCRKTIVFLPGLFGSQVQFTLSDGQIVGFPDFWDEPQLAKFDPIPMGLDGVPPIDISVFPSLHQRVDVLECDDKGVPLIPCPKPTLLMMKGVVTSPYNAVHNARKTLLRKIPDDFRLYTLIVYPYDWRADLTDAAASLIKSIADLKNLPGGLATTPDTDDQVAVIGHSTGGVVIRRALAPIAAAECTDSLDPLIRGFTRPSADTLINFAFFLSVPFSGAPKASSVLLTGLAEPAGDAQIPFIVPESLVAVSLSMPIVYHLHTSSAYPHRPCTSPTRPPGAGRDNEADKAAFVVDALDAGLMPYPWVVRSDGAKDPGYRKQLAVGAKAWHDLNAELHDRVSGHILKHALQSSNGLGQWFMGEVNRRGLKWQMDARARIGWNSYLADRAKKFHDKSATAVTGPWKTRSAILWGSCDKSTTLRQLNLSKVSSQTYVDRMAFLGAKRFPIANYESIVSRPVTRKVEDAHFRGGQQDLAQWRLDEQNGRVTETVWRLDWLGQYSAGDATVPSDSQLAEAKNLDVKLLTVTGGEAPQHMDSTKSDHVWMAVVESLHRGTIVSPTGRDSNALPTGLTLQTPGLPAGLSFHDP